MTPSAVAEVDRRRAGVGRLKVRSQATPVVEQHVGGGERLTIGPGRSPVLPPLQARTPGRRQPGHPRDAASRATTTPCFRPRARPPARRRGGRDPPRANSGRRRAARSNPTQAWPARHGPRNEGRTARDVDARPTARNTLLVHQFGALASQDATRAWRNWVHRFSIGKPQRP